MEENFMEECLHIKTPHNLITDENMSPNSEFSLKIIIQGDIESTSLSRALRIFLNIACTNCQGGIFFSVLIKKRG